MRPLVALFCLLWASAGLWTPSAIAAADTHERADGICDSLIQAGGKHLTVDMIAKTLRGRHEQLKAANSNPRHDKMFVCLLQLGLWKNGLLAKAVDPGEWDVATIEAVHAAFCLEPSPFDIADRKLNMLVSNIDRPESFCIEKNIDNEVVQNKSLPVKTQRARKQETVPQQQPATAAQPVQQSQQSMASLIARTTAVPTATSPKSSNIKSVEREDNPNTPPGNTANTTTSSLPGTSAPSIEPPDMPDLPELPGTAIVAAKPKPSGKCKPISQSKERDIKLNAKTIKGYGLCYYTVAFKDKGFSGLLQILEHPDHANNGPKWALPHDNEQSAFTTAVHMVGLYGGRMVAVQANERRLLAGQDPNRAFAMKRMKSCRHQRRVAPDYTAKMIKLLRPAKRVRGIWFSIHNNDAGFAANGGRGHISAAITTRVMKGLMAPKPASKGFANADNAVLMAGRDPLAKAMRHIRPVHNAGMNVIYEHIRGNRSDCSFSNYLVLNKGVRTGQYFNIEAQHGHTRTQIAMGKALMRVLGIARVGGQLATQ